MSKIFESVLGDSLTVPNFLLCTITSIVLGAVIALCYMFTCKKHTGSFVTTLAILPAVVQIVIIMVNGNLGAGVAVAGAFSLVRFRSIPGTAREIGSIFIALAAGLATGMGYIGFAVLFVVIVAAVDILYSIAKFGDRQSMGKKMLTVVIPESLDYTGIFNDIFSKYLQSYETISVKTTNMGSLYKLTYEIKLKDLKKEKEFIDELRTRNGNLDIICARRETGLEVL